MDKCETPDDDLPPHPEGPTMTDKTADKWLPIDSMPEGVERLTKIHDEQGERNVQHLVKLTRIPGKTRPMFWSGDVYVYYNPTHWMAS